MIDFYCEISTKECVRQVKRKDIKIKRGFKIKKQNKN